MITNDIIILCKKNQENGHRALYSACVPYVYSVVSRYVKLEYDRKDLVQDVFVQVFLNIKKYNSNIAPFKPWLRRITVTQCLMYLRKTKKFNNLIPISSINENENSVEIDLSNLEREGVLRLLEKMPIGYKTVFMLIVIDGYNHKEAGEQLDISKETSRSQLSRAKKWLKKNMDKKTKNKEYGAL
ncbi:MAG: RNA polymerase sigma factor [Saprospiraceae bacterium]